MWPFPPILSRLKKAVKNASDALIAAVVMAAVPPAAALARKKITKKKNLGLTNPRFF